MHGENPLLWMTMVYFKHTEGSLEVGILLAKMGPRVLKGKFPLFSGDGLMKQV